MSALHLMRQQTESTLPSSLDLHTVVHVVHQRPAPMHVYLPCMCIDAA